VRVKALAPVLAEIHPASQYPFCSQLLQDLAARSRSDLLAGLRALAPCLAPLGGVEAVVETARAIQGVVRWWP
jgi:hypothetical protein